MSINSDSQVTRVTKTLVIGLGSTGTAIADIVAQRVRWEMQDVRRAPWLQFLCIESDMAEKSKLQAIDDRDFRDLAISAHDFRHMTEDPAAYNATINLNSWIDPETIRKLPGQEVTAGVGNIRMLGRLTLFHEANYRKLTDAVTSRLDKLRSLSSAEAKEVRGALIDGSDPSIAFTSDSIRVIIVGTLCGGTCSGLASDFGYFMRNRLREGDKLSAMFTLPNPQLTQAHVELAERFKKNAYHALMELNHYHLGERTEEAPIRFPDGSLANTKKFPYDLTFLLMPRSIGRTGEQELSQATADRIFLEVFVPETDSFGDAVNAAVFGQGDDDAKADRDHRAHVFSTFGLSTVEFPAQQVMEACSKRLMEYTLKSWSTRTMDERDADERVQQDLGFTWDGIRNLLQTTGESATIQGALDAKIAEIDRLLVRDPEGAARSLQALRASLNPASGTQPGDIMSPGGIPAALSRARGLAADQAVQRFRAMTKRMLSDYFAGPGQLGIVMNRARARLTELKHEQPAGFSAHQKQVEQSLNRIQAYKRNPLLSAMFLKDEAIRIESKNLRKALLKEIDARLNFAAYAVLQDTSDVRRSEHGRGLLTRIEQEIKPIQRRLEGLRSRLTALHNQVSQRANELSRTEPAVNGVIIFEPEHGREGTVPTELRNHILNYVDDPGMEWEEARERVARELVQVWDSLAEAVVPPRNVDDDWLLQDFIPHATRQILPTEALQEFERAALAPFTTLAQVNVLDRWKNDAQGGFIHHDKARDAAKQSAPFLDVSQTLAQQGGRSPVPVRRFVLTPPSRNQEEFKTIVDSVLTNLKSAESRERFRVVMLEEWYRFPLSATPTVLSDISGHSLENARCTDFPTFWTRKDIGWTGISRREIETAKTAEELLALGILLNLVELGKGAIELRLGRKLGDDGTRRLPLSFQRATRMLARSEMDLDGRSLAGATDMLDIQIKEYVKAIPVDDANKHSVFVEQLNGYLDDKRGSAIDDWNTRAVIEYVRRYLARDKELFEASYKVFAPAQELISSLRQTAGQTKPRGGVFEKDGFYCPNCGGLVGETEQDAARNGWRCYINPSEHNLDNSYGVSVHR